MVPRGASLSRRLSWVRLVAPRTVQRVSVLRAVWLCKVTPVILHGVVSPQAEGLGMRVWVLRVEGSRAVFRG